MACSEKQLKSNRENSKKSTGPKTKAGKMISSRNSLLHGLYSNRLILNSANHKEDKVEFELLLESLRSELDPQSVSQDYLVQKIASCFWRSMRLVSAETSHVNNQLNDINNNWRYRELVKSLVDEVTDISDIEDETFLEFVSNQVGVNSIPKNKFADTLVRYELRLDRQLMRSFRLFNQLKDKELAADARREKNREKQKRKEKGFGG